MHRGWRQISLVIGAGEIGGGEIGAGELGAIRVAGEIGSGKVGSRQVEALEVGSREIATTTILAACRQQIDQMAARAGSANAGTNPRPRIKRAEKIRTHAGPPLSFR